MAQEFEGVRRFSFQFRYRNDGGTVDVSVFVVNSGLRAGYFNGEITLVSYYTPGRNSQYPAFGQVTHVASELPIMLRRTLNMRFDRPTPERDNQWRLLRVILPVILHTTMHFICNVLGLPGQFGRALFRFNGVRDVRDEGECRAMVGGVVHVIPQPGDDATAFGGLFSGSFYRVSAHGAPMYTYVSYAPVDVRMDAISDLVRELGEVGPIEGTYEEFVERRFRGQSNPQEG